MYALLLVGMTSSSYAARCQDTKEKDCIEDLSCYWKIGTLYGGTCEHKKCESYSENECSVRNVATANTNIWWKNCRFVKSEQKCKSVRSCEQIDSQEYCTNLNTGPNCEWKNDSCVTK